jgi:fatty acid amide hydrolase
MAHRERQEIGAITDLSASEQAQEIRSGHLSAREVVEAHIQRIEAVNPKLNAVVIPLFDQARAEAAAADDARHRGDPLGPLHGVPITIKEQHRVKGTPTTLGATHQIGKLYDAEGPLVRKLREAGAIILGKTNLLQTLMGWETDNRVYGRTSNPWNLERSPGGSSGGEGAIIAARGSPLGLAADLGGSIRVPAHFCGLHGLKPTAGRLTNDDFPPGLLPIGNGLAALVQQPGPIARTVADLQLAMALLTETSFEATRDLVAPVPWPDPSAVHVAGMRVGMYTDNGSFPASPALRRAVEEAADALRQRGATVEPFTPPDAAEGIRVFLGIATAGGSKALKRLLGDERPIPQIAGLVQAMDSPFFISPILATILDARGQHHLAHALRSVGACSTEQYWALVDARNRYRSHFLQALDEGSFDGVLCPPFALPALTHETSQHLLPAASYAIAYNVIGAPAGVVSTTKVRSGEECDRKASKDLADTTARVVEQGSAGLPVGVQVVARHWREDIVLAIMAAVEDHFRSTPNYPTRPDFEIEDRSAERATHHEPRPA